MRGYGTAFLRRVALGAWILALAAPGGAWAETPGEGGDAQRGEARYGVCRPCHEIGRGARHRTGPSLNGLFGRKAGSAESYAYSASMVFTGMRGVVWSEETLEAYLSDPKKFTPGTAMPLVGVSGEANRRDLIAFLREASTEGTPLYERSGPEALRGVARSGAGSGVQ